MRGFIMCRAQVTQLRRSNKENEIKRAQSIHGEITLTTKFNTLIGTPKDRDNLGGVTVDVINGKTYS